MNEITICHNEINGDVLREIRSLLIAPLSRKIVLLVLLVYAAMTVAVIAAGLWGWIAVFTLIMLFFLFLQPYLRQNRLIEQMIRGMRSTYGKPSCSFDVTLEAENVKSINVKTRETVRLPYADFIRMKETKNLIALVTVQGHLVVLDRAKMDEETQKQVLAIIGEKCAGVQRV